MLLFYFFIEKHQAWSGVQGLLFKPLAGLMWSLASWLFRESAICSPQRPVTSSKGQPLCHHPSGWENFGYHIFIFLRKSPLQTGLMLALRAPQNSGYYDIQ